jgi:hypothetical protein
VEQKRPDVMVLDFVWRDRALLRAQLIEEGYEVVALDAWPIPNVYRRPGMGPRVLLIDLHDLPKPRETLDEVRCMLPAERVLVVTALGSLPVEQVRQFRFNVVERPVTVGEIVRSVAVLLSGITATSTPESRPLPLEYSDSTDPMSDSD